VTRWTAGDRVVVAPAYVDSEDPKAHADAMTADQRAWGFETNFGGLADFAVEDGYDIASVRFTGLIREDNASNPAPFDELWHVRKKTGERNPTWLIAGIQQMPE